jgi:hypothetical protein
MLTTKNTRALVAGPAPAKEGSTMKIKIIDATFIRGEYVGPGDEIEAPESDAIELIRAGTAEAAPEVEKKRPAQKAAAAAAPEVEKKVPRKKAPAKTKKTKAAEKPAAAASKPKTTGKK